MLYNYLQLVAYRLATFATLKCYHCPHVILAAAVKNRVRNKACLSLGGRSGEKGCAWPITYLL